MEILRCDLGSTFQGLRCCVVSVALVVTGARDRGTTAEDVVCPLKLATGVGWYDCPASLCQAHGVHLGRPECDSFVGKERHGLRVGALGHGQTHVEGSKPAGVFALDAEHQLLHRSRRTSIRRCGHRWRDEQGSQARRRLRGMAHGGCTRSDVVVEGRGDAGMLDQNRARLWGRTATNTSRARVQASRVESGK